MNPSAALLFVDQAGLSVGIWATVLALAFCSGRVEAGGHRLRHTKTYTCLASHCYQGADGANSNLKINDNGTSYQGGDVGNTYNGSSKTWFEFPANTIQNDLAGAALNYTKVKLNNNHSWYGSGMTVALGWDAKTSFGSTAGNPSGAGIDVYEYHIDKGQTLTKDVTGQGFGNAFQSGAALNLVLFRNTNNLQYYGFFAGSNQSGPAQLIINYTK